jgi:predicted nucleic-acid-binding protein
MTLPVALDTNLLVRLLSGDEPEQARRVADLIDTSPACFVPITVVLELEWMLRGAYRLDRPAVIAALEGLMAIRQHRRAARSGAPLSALESSADTAETSSDLVLDVSLSWAWCFV